jgi:hypothetical protein
VSHREFGNKAAIPTPRCPRNRQRRSTALNPVDEEVLRGEMSWEEETGI